MRANFQTSRSGWLSATLLLASLTLVVCILYWAREILIPIALAVLLTFILAPIVSALRRRGVERNLSVVLTVVLTFLVLGGIGTMIVFEFRGLANDLPKYRQNIRKKIADVRLAGKGGPIEKVQETVKEVIDEIKQEEATATKSKPGVPVVVTDDKSGEASGVPLVGPLLEPLASAGLVIVLVIFMLLRREDLRDRLLRLAGYGRLAATTKAIDEAGKRVSKYLLRQSLLNAGFGIAVGTGLFFIGLPYALLWGFLAAIARFIPYVGPWLGALAPILMSLAVFDSWTAPLLIVGLVVVLELITNMLVEPMLYGQSIGVSEVALLIMIAFWTWLWGPIGLVLAAPLTVCLLVICKSVPDLEFIGLLLSSEPAMDPHHGFYQRLVAKDGDEAQEIAESWLKQHSSLELFEQLLIPTLLSCGRDYERGRLTEEDRAFVFGAIRQFVEEGDFLIREGREPTPEASAELPTSMEPGLILGCPAGNEADELMLLMLAALLRAERWNMRVLSPALFSAECLAEVEKTRPILVCVGFLGQGPPLPLRRLCKRLRGSVPQLPVVAGCWAVKDREKVEYQFAGFVRSIGWSLAETRNQVVQLARAEAVVAQAGSPARTPHDGLSQESNANLILSEQP